MGTWDIGPFDNDTAADLGGDLDEAAASQREGVAHGTLTDVIDTVGYLEAPESERAVAAAALVAAHGRHLPLTRPPVLELSTSGAAAELHGLHGLHGPTGGGTGSGKDRGAAHLARFGDPSGRVAALPHGPEGLVGVVGRPAPWPVRRAGSRCRPRRG
ncbi:DUF4259 domain-containing protein [Streptomyces sp. NBC_00435]|uniref:DUF4259 domain-containing protein n=1 Tax=Streptomyces sp. NBC_00435 TaxID=2903649 RepID=UPI002E2128FC